MELHREGSAPAVCTAGLFNPVEGSICGMDLVKAILHCLSAVGGVPNDGGCNFEDPLGTARIS